MKFGHATEDLLDDLQLRLPVDHRSNYKGAPTTKTSYHVGCGKWGIKAWVGPLYPEGTKEKDFLQQYIAHFRSIELNSTFYRLSRTSIEKWASASTETTFQFCPKWSQRVSHFKRLSDVEENTQYFMDTVGLFGDNLGCTFMTLPPNFTAKYLDRVLAFVELLPPGYPIAIEFRHSSWFEEETFDKVQDLLRTRQLATVITDVALRRDVLHMCNTCPTAFIRFNGYGLHPSDYMRLDEWTERLGQWVGLEKVYFFMHQQNEEHSIKLCSYFIEKLNEHLDANLPPLTLH